MRPLGPGHEERRDVFDGGGEVERLRALLERMAGAMGDSIPLACQDWANTKAAYRFFSNDRVGEEEILSGHFASTRARFAAAAGPILVAHDTTEFTYRCERADRIGQTYRVNSGKDKDGRFRMHTVCGLLMHSSLAITTEGLSLGLGAVKFWTRKTFKGTAALKRRVNPTLRRMDTALASIAVTIYARLDDWRRGQR